MIGRDLLELLLPSGFIPVVIELAHQITTADPGEARILPFNAPGLSDGKPRPCGQGPRASADFCCLSWGDAGAPNWAYLAPGAGCGCGSSGTRSREYLEAFARLEQIASLAASCSPDVRREVEDDKRAVAALLNSGVYAVPGGFDCDPEEAADKRPTIAQARAALQAFAERVGDECFKSTTGEVADLGRKVLAGAAAPLGGSSKTALIAAAIVGALVLVVVARRFFP